MIGALSGNAGRMRIREVVYATGLCVVIAVPACSHSVDGSAVAAEATTTVANSWKSPQGTWIGIYECSQGTTGLTLTVQSEAQADSTSRRFRKTPRHPRAASACAGRSNRADWSSTNRPGSTGPVPT